MARKTGRRNDCSIRILAFLGTRPKADTREVAAAIDHDRRHTNRILSALWKTERVKKLRAGQDGRGGNSAEWALNEDKTKT